MVTTVEQEGGDDEDGGVYHPSAVPWMVGRMADGPCFPRLRMYIYLVSNLRFDLIIYTHHHSPPARGAGAARPLPRAGIYLPVYIHKAPPCVSAYIYTYTRAHTLPLPCTHNPPTQQTGRLWLAQVRRALQPPAESGDGEEGEEEGARAARLQHATAVVASVLLGVQRVVEDGGALTLTDAAAGARQVSDDGMCHKGIENDGRLTDTLHNPYMYDMIAGQRHRPPPRPPPPAAPAAPASTSSSNTLHRGREG